MTSSGAWFEDKIKCEDDNLCGKDCLTGYNEELIDPISGKFTSVLRALIIVAIAVDILSIKYRQLTHLVPYVECLTRLVVVMVPNTAS